MAVYGCQHLKLEYVGKAYRICILRSKPDSGKPTVRDCRGATGNVTLLRENARACFLPDYHIVGGIPTEEGLANHS